MSSAANGNKKKKGVKIMKGSLYEKAMQETVKPHIGDKLFLTRLLGRLYFDLTSSTQPSGHLWGVDFPTHIATMKAILDSLDSIPSFISREEIENLEKGLAALYAKESKS